MAVKERCYHTFAQVDSYVDEMDNEIHKIFECEFCKAWYETVFYKDTLYTSQSDLKEPR